MNENTSSRQHYLFALLLFMAGLLIILIFLTVRSQADSNGSDTSANIENTAPTVDAVTFSLSDQGGAANSVDLTENSTKSAYVFGTFTDVNGCDTVTANGSAVNVVLYSSANPGATGGTSCSADNSDCYIINSACTLSECTGGTDITGSYSCPVSIQYYATPTAWIASVTAGDGYATSTALTDETAITTLAGLDLTNTDIAYGTLAIGATSSAQTVPVDNVGNIKIDSKISGTALTCVDGSIAVGQQHFSTSADFAAGSYYSAGTALSDSSSTVNIDLAKRTEGASSTQNFYFLLSVPNDGTGYSGACTGSILFEGIAG